MRASSEPLTPRLPDGVEVLASAPPDLAPILTPDALAFVAGLERAFGDRRRALLDRRRERREALAAGERLGFLGETAAIRDRDWQVAPAPTDLLDRRVEITGPAEAKMAINALNSGARVFMADLEDALSPTWANSLGGQRVLLDAVRRDLTFTNADGRHYALAPETATMVVRPRGWHLVERHVTVDGWPISAGLFDLGLFLFHAGRAAVERDTGPARGPYVYLPKLESHLEARLWNEVFVAAQQALGMPRGTIRATVLIETIWAAYEMDEILWELREHASGLNAGRWDYIFSLIKAFRDDPTMILPDRAQVTMAVPFMRAYTQLLVKTCHRRGAHAIGGMSAFIPDRRRPEVTDRALARVREDKRREAADGFDGTWVAHPDLVPEAMACFDAVLGDRPDQRHRLREDVAVTATQLTDVTIPGGAVTDAGVQANVGVALRYLAAWLGGQGAAAIDALMEDVATAEISRSQLWQWRRHGVRTAEGTLVDGALLSRLIDETRATLDGSTAPRACGILEDLVLGDAFADFLTLRAYRLLD
jgi:malate synthase